jgi:hypothetical protein
MSLRIQGGNCCRSQAHRQTLKTELAALEKHTLWSGFTEAKRHALLASQGPFRILIRI